MSLSNSDSRLNRNHELPVPRVLTALEKVTGRPPTKTSAGWSHCCPVHDDKRASLSVTQAEDGRALLHCHAGCAIPEICAAIDLRVPDLFPTADTLPRPRNKTGRKPMGKSYATAGEAVASLERRHGLRSATWTYQNVNGDPIGLVVRWDLADGTKDIRPVSRHADGWRIGGMPAPRPLYRLPELTGADQVIVTEGEKAVEAARSMGQVATTSAQIDPTLDAISKESQRTIESHLTDYEAKLRTAGRTDQYVRETLRYIREIAAASSWRIAVDIGADDVIRFTGTLRDNLKSARTIQAREGT